MIKKGILSAIKAVRKTVLIPVKLYQRFISPLKPRCCRFTPSCSQYAIEAFTKRGFFVGFGLTVWRILRCNPFSKGGYDPVPDVKRRKKSTHTSCIDTSENNTQEKEN